MNKELSPMMIRCLEEVIKTMKAVQESLVFIEKNPKEAVEVEEFITDKVMLSSSITIVESILNGKLK